MQVHFAAVYKLQLSMKKDIHDSPCENTSGSREKRKEATTSTEGSMFTRRSKYVLDCKPGRAVGEQSTDIYFGASVMSGHDELDADSVRAVFNERPALEECLIQIHFRLLHIALTPESCSSHACILSQLYAAALRCRAPDRINDTVNGNAADKGAKHTGPSVCKTAQPHSSSCAKYLVPQDLGQCHDTFVVKSGRNG